MKQTEQVQIFVSKTQKESNKIPRKIESRKNIVFGKRRSP